MYWKLRCLKLHFWQEIGRKPVEIDGVYELRETQSPYMHVFDAKKSDLCQYNSHL